MTTELISQRDIEAARELVTACGLSFEESFDNLVGIFAGERLAATAARDGSILKMFAIAPDFQGGPVLGELVTELIRLGGLAGHDAFFIFTSPGSAPSFQALNFYPIVEHPRVVLLEYGGGLGRYLEAHGELVRPGENGAVVVNCNPFTLGHRYLIEEAARQVDTLYAFVVREDRSAFPFDVRIRLVRAGTEDLPNVTVLDSSHYAVSGVTFPAYFLKSGEDVARLQMEVDLLLFGRRIAPFFSIRRRFIGTEPFCRTTRMYSDVMKEVLAPLGVETIRVERMAVDGEAVSAYRVRQALRHEAYETMRRLVPETTLRYLLSEEAREVRERLKSYDRRH